MGQEIKKEVWDKLQANILARYGTEKNEVGRFSHRGFKSAKNLGDVLNDRIPNQSCLDVGCGLMALPYYMEVADKVNFSGIDPLDDGEKRDFEYICAVAEDIPFGDGEFENILFASALDHFFNPALAVAEAKRVLKDGGLLFVWTALIGEAGDEYHPIGYTEKSIMSLFNEFEFVEMTIINIAEYLYIFRK